MIFSNRQSSTTWVAWMNSLAFYRPHAPPSGHSTALLYIELWMNFPSMLSTNQPLKPLKSTFSYSLWKLWKLWKFMVQAISESYENHTHCTTCPGNQGLLWHLWFMLTLSRAELQDCTVIFLGLMLHFKTKFQRFSSHTACYQKHVYTQNL